MKLNNYLLKIESKCYNKNKEEICLHGISSIIKPVYQELKLKFNKEVIKLIYNQLKIPYQTLYAWISGSNPIPISKAYLLLKIWKENCDKTQEEFENIWNSIYENNTGYSQNGQRKIVIPRIMSDKLAYLIGFFQGDGHLKKENNKNYQECSIYFYEANKNVLEKINEKISELFGIKGPIYFQANSTGRWFSLRICSKPIYLFLQKVINLKTGKKIRNVDVPEIIKSSEVQYQISFIRGFFDAEGGVGETKKNPWLDIGQASSNSPCEILIWTQKVLRGKGIALSEPQRTQNQEFFRIRTSKRETIKRFFEIVSSDHIEKIIKFNAIINKNVRS